jgi:hypothetical protein
MPGTPQIQAVSQGNISGLGWHIPQLLRAWLSHTASKPSPTILMNKRTNVHMENSERNQLKYLWGKSSGVELTFFRAGDLRDEQ